MVQVDGKSQSVETCHIVLWCVLLVAYERCCVVDFVRKREKVPMHCRLLQAHCNKQAKATPKSAMARSRLQCVPTFYVDSSPLAEPLSVLRSKLIGDN